MKKLLVSITLFVILVLCLSSPVGAGVVNEWHGGNRVVHDVSSGTYWYPYLAADGLLDETRANQLAYIDGLNAQSYGGISDWQMASYRQTRRLKISLSYTAREGRMPTAFGPAFGTPVTEDRHAGSPYLAWNVQSDAFFDVTGYVDLTGMGLPLPNAQVFNGRTNREPGWQRGEDGLPIWVEYSECDDHWMAHDYFSPGQNATMMFNYDQHYLVDDAEGNPFLGGVGAWIVSTSKPQAVPAPGTLLLGCMGVGLVGYLRRRRTL